VKQKRLNIAKSLDAKNPDSSRIQGTNTNLELLSSLRKIRRG